MIALYREAGYDFLALTDHRKLSEQEHFEENLLMIPGMEMDFLYPTQALHIVGIGMNESFAQQREKWCESPQSCIDTMRACGGLAILAHPHWSLNTLDTMRSLKNLQSRFRHTVERRSGGQFQYSGYRQCQRGVFPLCGGG